MVKLDFLKGKRFAGPGTKLAYEAALGRFLVAVNSVENEVRDILHLSLKGLEREDVYTEIKGAEYKTTLQLQLLALGHGSLPDVPYAAIFELNRKRNILAHGHYDQDLFSDEFKIVGRQKATLMTIAEIISAAIDAETIRDNLRSEIMSHFYRIEDLDA